MQQKTLTVIDNTGIHARPATVLVNKAEGFNSDEQEAIDAIYEVIKQEGLGE